MAERGKRTGSFFQAHDDAKIGVPAEAPLTVIEDTTAREQELQAKRPSAPSTESVGGPEVGTSSSFEEKEVTPAASLDIAPKGPVAVGSPEHKRMQAQIAANNAAAELEARVSKRHREGIAKIKSPGQTPVERDSSEAGQTARDIQAGKSVDLAPASAGELWDNLNKMHQHLVDFIGNLPHHIERHASQYNALASKISELDPRHEVIPALQGHADSIRQYIPVTVNADKRMSARAIRDAVLRPQNQDHDIKGTLRNTAKVERRTGYPLKVGNIAGSGVIQNDAPKALREIASTLEELRPGGAKFAEMGTNVNHPALMEVLDKITKTNHMINQEVKPIDGEGFGTGLSPATLAVERHRANQGNLPVPNPSVGLEAHREPHPFWQPGGRIPTGKMVNKVDKDGNALADKDGNPIQEPEMRDMEWDDVLSKPGHVWGLPAKDRLGRRKGPLDQVLISDENIEAYKNSPEKPAQDLARRMTTIKNDYANGKTAGYEAQMDPDENWRTTESKFGKGVTKLKGRGNSRAQLLQFELEQATRAAEQRAARAADPGAGGGGAAPVKGQTKTPGAVAKDRAVSNVSVDAITREMDDTAYRTERANTIKDTLVRGGKISEEDGKWLGQRANGAIAADVMAHVEKHRAAYAAVVEAHRRGEKPDQESRRIVSANLGEQGMLQARREGIAARGE
jgi:hypothetical protein